MADQTQTFLTEMQDYLAAQDANNSRLFPTEQRDQPAYKEKAKSWATQGRTKVRRAVYQDTLAQLSEAGVQGIARAEQPATSDGFTVGDTLPADKLFNNAFNSTAPIVYSDDTTGEFFVDQDSDIHEFASLRQTQYEAGKPQIGWTDYNKRKLTTAQAMMVGFVAQQTLAFEGAAGGIGSYLGGVAAEFEQSEDEMRKELGYGPEYLDRIRSEIQGGDLEKARAMFRESQAAVDAARLPKIQATKDAYKAGAQSFARGVLNAAIIGTQGMRTKILGADPSNPQDIRENVGRGGGGFLVKAAEMTGSAVGVMPYSIPAMATRNPSVAAALTSPFYAMGHSESWDRRMRIWEDQAMEAQALGAPAPLKPTLTELERQSNVGGIIEFGSEFTIDRLQVALPQISNWAGNKFLGKTFGQSAKKAASMSDEMLLSMARKQGPLGALKTAAIIGAAGVTEGIEEAIPELGKEFTDLFFIPKGYENDFFSASTAEAIGTGAIAGLLMGGSQQAFGKEGRQTRKAARQTKVAAANASDIVVGVLQEKSTRGIIDRFSANATQARGATMALHQVEEMGAGTRNAMFVGSDHADATLTEDVLNRMEALGIGTKPIGVMSGMRVYAPTASAAAVKEAARNGDVAAVTGRAEIMDPKLLMVGAFVVRNKGGQILDVVPYSDSDTANKAFPTLANSAANSGNTVSNVTGEGLAQLSESIDLQVDADSTMRKIVPPSRRAQTPRMAARGVRALQLDIFNHAAGRRRGATDSAPFSSPYLTADEIGDATNADVKVEVALTQVQEENQTPEERAVGRSTGVVPTILDGVVRFTITGKDGTTRVVEKATQQQGAYLSQVSPDGLYLIRDNQNAFTARNAFAIAMHEMRHRLVGRSRAGAAYLAKLLYLDPAFAMRGGAQYMREIQPEALAGMSEAEIIGYYAALHGAALKVLSNDSASKRDKIAARKDMRSVEQFSEESMANASENALGQTAQAAAEWQGVHKDSQERGIKKFVGWFANVLSRNGFAGKHAQQALYEIQQRLAGVKESELQIHEQFKGELEQKFKEDMQKFEDRKLEAAEASVPAKRKPAATPATATPAAAPASVATPSGIAVAGSDDDQNITNATEALAAAQALPPDQRAGAVAAVIQALSAAMPLLGGTSATIGVGASTSTTSGVQRDKLSFPEGAPAATAATDTAATPTVESEPVPSMSAGREWNSNTASIFSALADMQRGVPETAMLNIQKASDGGSVHSVVSEAVGDIIHRITSKASMGPVGMASWGLIDALPKIKRSLNFLGASDREAFFVEQDKGGPALERAMKNYADAHAKLPVYNRAQELARTAAVEFGRGSLQGTVDSLKELESMMEDPNAWEAAASEFDPNYGKKGARGQDPDVQASLRPNIVKAVEAKRIEQERLDALSPYYDDSNDYSLRKPTGAMEIINGVTPTAPVELGSVARVLRSRSYTQSPDEEISMSLRNRAGRRDANEDVRALRNSFMGSRGVTPEQQIEDTYADVNPAFAKRLANWFDSAKSNYNDSKTLAAYQRFNQETLDQYQHLVNNGYKMIPWAGKGQPYANSAEMIEDVRNNKRIYYFKTINPQEAISFGSDPSVFAEAIRKNPMLNDTRVDVLDSEGNTHNQTYNDIFRAVHDIIGHAAEGFQFGPRGEENAYRSHAVMYTPIARQAMATETRAQNSWVNFGPNRSNPDGSVWGNEDPRYDAWLAGLKEGEGYAEQKMVLTPSEFTEIKAEPKDVDLTDEWPTLDVTGPTSVDTSEELPQVWASLRPIRQDEMSPNMRAWSAGSKVVDEDGSLIPIYHGTSKDKDFRVFKVGKRGAWFTTNPAIAALYAKENDSQKTTYKQGPDGKFRYFFENTASRVFMVVLSIKNPANRDDIGQTNLMRLVRDTNYAKAQREVFEELRLRGFDGVHLEAEETWIAFDPSQIKSYFNGEPTNSPRIDMSLRKPKQTSPTAVRARLDPLQAGRKYLNDRGVTMEEQPRLLAAAAKIGNDTAIERAQPLQWLAEFRKSKLTNTLTPYTTADMSRTMGQYVDAENAQRVIDGRPPVKLPAGFDVKELQLQPFWVGGLKAGYAIKRAVDFGNDGIPTFNGYEPVALFSNESRSVTGFIPPVMLSAIGFKPDMPMRFDCYDVRDLNAPRGTGKLPSNYARFGAVTTGSMSFNPKYLRDDNGDMVGDDVAKQEIAIAKIEASWASNLGGNWVKPATRIIEETDDGPIFTNYPELWTATYGLTAEQRKQVFTDGVRGYTDNPQGIQELASGNPADVSSNVPSYVAAERQADTSSGAAGSAVVAVSGSTDGAPRRTGKRGSRNVSGSAGRDAASSRVNLLELGRILTDSGIAIREKRGSAQQIGQSLSASALIPLNAVGITPAQVSEIVALERRVTALERVFDEIVVPPAIPDYVADPKKSAKQNAALKAARDVANDARKPFVTASGQAKNRRDKARKELYARRQEYGGSAAFPLGLAALRTFTDERSAANKKMPAVGPLLGVLDTYAKSIVDMFREVVTRNGKVTDFMREVMAESMAADVVYALSRSGANAAGWYSNTITNMWANLETVYSGLQNPETRVEHRAIFSLALAISSNGERVWANMQIAKKIYENYLDTGELQMPEGKSSSRGDVVNKSLAAVNAVRLTMPNQTWSEVSDFMLQKAKFKDHNKTLRALRQTMMAQVRAENGEALAIAEARLADFKAKAKAEKAKAGSKDVDEFETDASELMSESDMQDQPVEAPSQKGSKLADYLTPALAQQIAAINTLNIGDSKDDLGYMAAFIGPKIGSFFANLNGKFDTLTADIWFVRSFARSIGDLVKPKFSGIQSALFQFVNPSNTQAAKDAGLTDAIINDPTALAAWSKALEKAYMKKLAAKQKAEGPNAKLKKTELEAAANRFNSSAVGSSDSPEGRAERSLMRAIGIQAMEIVQKRTGVQVTLAEMQALMWYVEKELYEAYGAGSATADQDFEQASKAVVQMRKQEIADGNSQFSMRRGASGVRDEATLRYLDRYDELRRYGEVARARTGSLPEIANPYLGARILSGRISTRQKGAERRYADLLRRMYQDGVQLLEMDEFLTAQHAEERNDYIAGINPAFPDAGSGMATADAQAIMQRERANGRFSRLDAFANEWRGLLRESLDERLASGLIQQDVYDTITSLYSHYVPLRGAPVQQFDADFDEFGEGTGAGMSTSGIGLPRAMGRQSIAAGVTSQIGFVHEDAFRRVAKNQVGQQFLNLVRAVRDPSMAEVIRPRRRAIVNGVVRQQHDGAWMQDPRNFGVYVADPVRIGGHNYERGDLVVIKINNRRLAEGIATQTVSLRSAEKALREVNNVWRFMTTGYGNPAFAPVNLIRDLSQGTLNNFGARGLRDTASMLSRWPSAFAGIMRDVWLGNQPTGAYRDFVNAGGDQLYWRENDLEIKNADFNAIAARVARKDPNDRTLARTLFGWYPAFFTAAESATRVAQYQQRVSTGSTRSEAALAARDITVDFAKGGAAKPVLNTWYMFLNASIQGSANTLQALNRNKGIAPALMMLGYAQAALARAMGGDDEETGQSVWDNIPEYEKTANLFFFDPSGSGKYVKIPLPYGFNVLVSAGARMADATLGRATVGDFASGVLTDALNSFNPIGGSGIRGGTANVLTSLMPTMARPLAEIAVNQDFSGRPIYPKSFDRFPPPDSTTKFDGTPLPYVATAEALNSATGGDEFEGGLIDISPSTMQYLAGYYMSGSGRLMDRIYKSTLGTEPVTANDLPLTRSFVGDARNDTRGLSQTYYGMAEQASSTMSRLQVAQDVGADPERRIAARDGLDMEQVQMGALIKELDENLVKIRKAIRVVDRTERDRLIEVRNSLMKLAVKRRNELTDAKNSE